jgi:hypothetical protein
MSFSCVCYPYAMVCNYTHDGHNSRTMELPVVDGEAVVPNDNNACEPGAVDGLGLQPAQGVDQCDGPVLDGATELPVSQASTFTVHVKTDTDGVVSQLVIPYTNKPNQAVDVAKSFDDSVGWQESRWSEVPVTIGIDFNDIDFDQL